MSDTSMDVPAALLNVVMQLQADPFRYRLFGVYWWAIKALLRRAGYGPETLGILGSYIDQETAALIPSMNLQDTLMAAFDEYGQNATYPHPDGRVEDPDGELVTIFDQDAGF